MDLKVIQKALAAVCGEVREGLPGDAIGGTGVGDVGEAVSSGLGGLGGLGAALVALPGSTEEAAAVMRVAAEHELAVVIRGGGSRLAWGVLPSRCDLVIDTSRMSGVVEHSAGDLVARVRAGTRAGELADVLALAGQELALDGPPDATIGGVVASGLAGPRRLRYGTARDLLIGITIVRADGTVAKSGGKVVKNVAGYDMGKLFAGSAGTLGLITDLTFRLHPLPAARAYVTAEYAAVAVACDAVAAAANSPLVPSAVEVSRAEPGGPIEVGVLLEGSADGVPARAQRLAYLLGAGEISAGPPAWWQAAPKAGPGETLIQVSFWVSALGRVFDAIEAAAAKADVSPVLGGSAGAGVLYVRIAEAAAGGRDAGRRDPGRRDAGRRDPGAVADFFGALREALPPGRGSVTVLTAPASVLAALAGQPGLSGDVPGLHLMRAVKDQFDPDHRLAHGRFPETL
jgi:glycolate oxidase FAD binding subunit